MAEHIARQVTDPSPRTRTRPSSRLGPAIRPHGYRKAPAPRRQMSASPPCRSSACTYRRLMGLFGEQAMSPVRRCQGADFRSACGAVGPRIMRGAPEARLLRQARRLTIILSAIMLVEPSRPPVSSASQGSAQGMVTIACASIPGTLPHLPVVSSRERSSDRYTTNQAIRLTKQ
jgi:hypothetical protein